MSLFLACPFAFFFLDECLTCKAAGVFVIYNFHLGLKFHNQY